MLSDTPVTTLISLGPLLVVTRPTIKAGSSECISRGTLSVLTFHRSFIFFTFSVVSVFSSFCQAVRCGLPPSVSQSAPITTRDENINPTRIRTFRICVYPYVVGAVYDRPQIRGRSQTAPTA